MTDELGRPVPPAGQVAGESGDGGAQGGEEQGHAVAPDRLRAGDRGDGHDHQGGGDPEGQDDGGEAGVVGTAHPASLPPAWYADELLTLYLGDCVEVMRELPADSVDAIVTDPPYGLEFMGHDWDRLGAGHEYPADGEGPWGRTERVRYGKSAASVQRWHEAWAREAFRVAKPGAYLLAFGGTRTYHRLASAIEDAGWEIRDCLVWAYASGFPKSLDVGKALDRMAGAERPVVGSKLVTGQAPDGSWAGNRVGVPRHSAEIPVTGPATEAAREWSGWGTALKPAWEPIVLARRPFAGPVAANVLARGTGALNIDATRIPYVSAEDAAEALAMAASLTRSMDAGTVAEPTSLPATYAKPPYDPTPGRWPANVLLTAPIFDGDWPGVVGGGESAGFGGFPPGAHYEHADDSTSYRPPAGSSPGYGDSGTYSRFFMVPKADRADREPLVRSELPESAGQEIYGAGMSTATKGVKPTPRTNTHPTVKPLELMRHLVRLVTPPRGVILDAFIGSGTTGIAANQEGFRCIGIDTQAEYLAITRARLAGHRLGLGLGG